MMNDQRYQAVRGERPRGGLSVVATVVLIVGGLAVLSFVAACTVVLGAAAASGSRAPMVADPAVKEPQQLPAPSSPAVFPIAPSTAVDHGAVALSEGERHHAAAELRRDLRHLLARGRAMERLRTRCDSNDLDACSECGDSMRRLQSEARELRGRAEQLDEPLLAGAASTAILCVSCSSGSLENCRWTEDGLQE